MVFLGKMLYLHSACLSPPRSILMGTGRLTEKPDEMPRGNLGMDWLPIHGGKYLIPLVASLDRNWDKL